MTRKRQNPEKILTNAERCKRFLEANLEKYRKNDALNKIKVDIANDISQSSDSELEAVS